MDDPLLGQRIRVFRKRLGISQVDLEIEANLAFGSVSRIENGQSNPTKETIKNIAEVLKLNTWQLEYLIGDLREPATDAEIGLAIAEINEYFQKKGVFAYLLDDRARILEISQSFSKFLEITPLEKERILGEPIVRLLLDESFGIRQKLSDTYFNNILYNGLSRIYAEMSFMKDDEYFEKIEYYINKNDEARRLWRDICKNGVDPVPTLDSRRVTFKLKGMEIELFYSVEPIPKYQRFRVIEYTPNNKIIRFLSKYFNL